MRGISFACALWFLPVDYRLFLLSFHIPKEDNSFLIVTIIEIIIRKLNVDKNSAIVE